MLYAIHIKTLQECLACTKHSMKVYYYYYKVSYILGMPLSTLKRLCLTFPPPAHPFRYFHSIMKDFGNIKYVAK